MANDSMACFNSSSVIDDDEPLEPDEDFDIVLDEETFPDDPGVNVSNDSTTVIILDDDGKQTELGVTGFSLHKMYHRSGYFQR